MDLKFYREGEQGPLVIFLHGYGGGPLEWHNLIPYFTENYQVWVPNLGPLFSNSKELSFSQQVGILSRHIHENNLQKHPFFLIGQSYGGTLSFGIRSHFQGLVLGQFLINPMPYFPLKVTRHLQLKALAAMNMIPAALPLFLKTKLGEMALSELAHVFGFGSDDRQKIESLSARKRLIVHKALQRFLWIAEHEDWEYWEAVLRDHRVPMTLVSGSLDPLFEETAFRSYQHLVPMSEFYAIEDGGHHLVKTHLESIRILLTEFLYKNTHHIASLSGY